MISRAELIDGLIGIEVGAEGQVAQEQRGAGAAGHGLHEDQHLFQGHGDGGVVAKHEHGEGVAYEGDVDASLLGYEGGGVVVDGQHNDGLLLVGHRGQLFDRDLAALFSHGNAFSYRGEGWFNS